VRSPNVYERYSWGRGSMSSRMIGWYGDGNGYVGNLALKPETADTLSAALNLKGEGAASWSLKIAPHYTRVDDYIDAVKLQDFTDMMGMPTPFAQLQFVNQDAEFYGIDVSGELIAAGASDGPFNGLPELATRLAADQNVTACVLSQWSRHVLGVNGAAASCGAEGLLPTRSGAPETMQALLEIPFTAPSFVRRSAGSPDPDEPPIPDAGTPVTPTGTTHRVRVDSDWGAGSCRTVFIDNGTATPQTWNVEFAKLGTINSLWNAVVDDSGALWKFTGAPHNATVGAMETTSFGFCVSTP
ncbi:MAG: TonB-dependent receptor domain-containing protein, partial [Archangium sp.]